MTQGDRRRRRLLADALQADINKLKRNEEELRKLLSKWSKSGVGVRADEQLRHDLEGSISYVTSAVKELQYKRAALFRPAPPKLVQEAPVL